MFSLVQSASTTVQTRQWQDGPLVLHLHFFLVNVVVYVFRALSRNVDWPGYPPSKLPRKVHHMKETTHTQKNKLEILRELSVTQSTDFFVCRVVPQMLFKEFIEMSSVSFADKVLQKLNIFFRQQIISFEYFCQIILAWLQPRLN